jgi:hypothetical protein
MIKQIECFVAMCDVCGKSVDDEAEMVSHYDTEAEALERALERDDFGGSGCEMVDNRLCCSKCWTYNDDDEITIRHRLK